MSLLDQIMADVPTLVPTDQELAEIRKLACDQRDWEKKVFQLETDLASAKEALKQVQEFLLPEAMANCGMKQFTMLDGSKITIKDDVFASIRKDYQEQAMRWLDDQNLGGVIKSEVDVMFARGESVKSQQLVEFCRKNGFNVTEKESVHASTLKALVKEQMANGVVFPEQFFSVMPFKKAIIK